MGIKEFGKNMVGTIQEKAGLGLLKVKAASPEILLVGGIACMVGAVVTGIMASKKHNEIMEDHFDQLEDAKAGIILPEAAVDGDEIHEGEAVSLSEKEIARNVRRVYCRTAAKMVKLYAPTVAFMAVSTACFIGMHNIQASRITALSGAYTGLKEVFDKYQERNIELNGEENHKLCKYGWHEEEVTKEDGTVEKKKVMNSPSDLEKQAEEREKMGKLPFHTLNFIFSRNTSKCYRGNANLDRTLLETVENTCNNYLNIHGFVTVNDVLDALGMERTVEGMYEGWVKGCGPDIDLGWRDSFNNRFLAGYPEEPVSLEFNTHGNIIDIINRIDKMREEERAKTLAAAKRKENVA